MSVERYLDDKFPTFEDLKNSLESESNRLKDEEQKLERKVDDERSESLARRKREMLQLKSYLDDTSTSSLTSVPSIDEFLNHLDKFGGTLQSQNVFTRKFNNLIAVSEALQVMKCCKRIAELSNDLYNALESDYKTTLVLYTDGLAEEKLLHDYSSNSDSSVVKALASKGLSIFDTSIRKVLQEKYETEFKESLDKLNWPKETPESSSELIALFKNVLITEPVYTTSPSIPKPLSAFRILAEPLVLRMKFHFDTERETNRLDKPEWMFSHFIGVVDEHFEFLKNTIQLALNDTPKLKRRNALHEFIVALLQPVYSKLEQMFPTVIPSPNLLSHLIYELVNFDNVLSEKYFFIPYHRDKWRGVSGDILAQKEWFDKWLAIEKKTTVERFEEIIDAIDAWEVDKDITESNNTKPTKSAVYLKDLLESITDHYKSLRSVNYKLRFLLNVQIDILDKYYEKLVDSLSVFDSSSSSIVRAVGGVSADIAKQLVGLEGLKHLFRIYGSADYVSNALEFWSEDLFFLELWEDVSKLSSKKSLDKKVHDTIEDVSTANVPQSEEDEGTLFDETIASYTRLKVRAMHSIQSLLKKELQSSMKDYFRQTGWNSTVTDTNFSSIEMSSKLMQPINTLSKLLLYLRDLLSTNDYELVLRSFGNDLETYIWNYIIQANQFSQAGGHQLKRDVAELWINLGLTRSATVRKIDQAIILLCLPYEDILESDYSKLKSQLELSSLTADELRGITQRRIS